MLDKTPFEGKHESNTENKTAADQSFAKMFCEQTHAAAAFLSAFQTISLAIFLKKLIHNDNSPEFKAKNKILRPTFTKQNSAFSSCAWKKHAQLSNVLNALTSLVTKKIVKIKGVKKFLKNR